MAAKMMPLDVFVEKMKKEIDRFGKEWKQEREKKGQKSAYPLKMYEGDWDDQLQQWLSMREE